MDLRLNYPQNGNLTLIDLRWFVLVPLYALLDIKTFSQEYIKTAPFNSGYQEVLDALRTPDLQSVNPPFGEHVFIAPAIGMGLKIAIGTHAWYWKGREFPKPVIEAIRPYPPLGVNDDQLAADIQIIRWAPRTRICSGQILPGYKACYMHSSWYRWQSGSIL